MIPVIPNPDWFYFLMCGGWGGNGGIRICVYLLVPASENSESCQKTSNSFFLRVELKSLERRLHCVPCNFFSENLFWERKSAWSWGWMGRGEGVGEEERSLSRLGTEHRAWRRALSHDHQIMTRAKSRNRPLSRLSHPGTVPSIAVLIF